MASTSNKSLLFKLFQSPLFLIIGTIICQAAFITMNRMTKDIEGWPNEDDVPDGRVLMSSEEINEVLRGTTRDTNATKSNQTKMDKQLGPYRFLHIENNRIHLAGILGLKDANKLARGGVEQETETIFKNVKIILEGYDGSSLEKDFKPPLPEKSVIVVDKLKFNASVEAELFASINYTRKMDLDFD